MPEPGFDKNQPIVAHGNPHDVLPFAVVRGLGNDDVIPQLAGTLEAHGMHFGFIEGCPVGLGFLVAKKIGAALAVFWKA